jgi:mannose-6-phosphate isomerase-like protein (cupin superfamily)
MILRTLSLAAASMVLAAPVAAQQPAPNHVTASEWRETISKPVNNLASHDYWTALGYRVMVVSRTGLGEVELHDTMNDLFIMQDGHAVIVVGGTIDGNRVTGPNEHRGGKITGGKTQRFGPGDMFWVPAGQPHQVAPEPGETIKYIVVKTEARTAPAPTP